MYSLSNAPWNVLMMLLLWLLLLFPGPESVTKQDQKSWAPRLIWNPTWKAPSQTHPFGLWQEWKIHVASVKPLRSGECLLQQLAWVALITLIWLRKKTQGRRDGIIPTMCVSWDTALFSQPQGTEKNEKVILSSWKYSWKSPVSPPSPWMPSPWQCLSNPIPPTCQLCGLQASYLNTSCLSFLIHKNGHKTVPTYWSSCKGWMC